MLGPIFACMSATMMPTMCQILVVTQLKYVFVYEIGLIAICKVLPPFDEEQQYGRPYQPKQSPSCLFPITSRGCSHCRGHCIDECCTSRARCTTIVMSGHASFISLFATTVV